jgi:hypothetical protein
MIETMGKPDKDLNEVMKHISDVIQKRIDEAYQKGINGGSLDVKQRVEGAYQRGLDDAWEAAEKLFSSMTDSDIEKAFPTEWNNGGFKALMNLQPQEAIAKLKAYEEQKADDDIKVGDEVIYIEHRFIVFATETKEHYASLFDVNGRHASASQRECKKTGRHFDIDRILEEMRT